MAPLHTLSSCGRNRAPQQKRPTAYLVCPITDDGARRPDRPSNLAHVVNRGRTMPEKPREIEECRTAFDHFAQRTSETVGAVTLAADGSAAGAGAAGAGAAGAGGAVSGER